MDEGFVSWRYARKVGVGFLLGGAGIIVARAAGLRGGRLANLPTTEAYIAGGVFAAIGLISLAISASPRASDLAVLFAKWLLFAVLLAMIFGTIGLLIMVFLNWPGDV